MASIPTYKWKFLISNLLGIELAIHKSYVVIISESDGAASSLMLGLPGIDGSRRIL